jgi:hypothetical protein
LSTTGSRQHRKGSPLGYYSAGARQREAPGRWFGQALPWLGLAAGQAVDTEADGPYTQVYGQINPLTGEHLGRAPRTADGMRAAILAGLEAAEPHATRERRSGRKSARSHSLQRRPPARCCAAPTTCATPGSLGGSTPAPPRPRSPPAGHSVEVLMRVYARCMTGLEDVWIGRMDQALHLEDPDASGGGEGDPE